MAEFTCVPPINYNKEPEVEETANEMHIKKEETGDTEWQNDQQKNMMCQETNAEDQETYDFFSARQPIGHPSNDAYSSWKQTTDTGRQKWVDFSSDLLTKELCALNPGDEKDHSGMEIVHHRKIEKEIDHNGPPGKESDSRETQITDMGLQQETCDVNFSQTDNTSTSHVQENKDNMVIHVVKRTREKTYMCGECGYRTAYKSHLSQHMRTHTGEKPYTCDQCDYSSARKSSLDNHLTVHHTGEKPYRCVECGYGTNQKARLTEHMRTHSGEKPHKCHHCDYSAAKKSTLDKHLRKHTGETPYMCEECGFRTARQSTLSQHMRTHSGEKPFKCDLCDYSAARKSTLVAHRSKHTGEKPLMCSECEFRTARTSDLCRHMRTHTGERPYKCDQCDYSASQKRHLIEHRTKHTAEKPFIFRECMSGLSRRSDLYRDIKGEIEDDEWEQENMLCQKTYAKDQEAFDYFGATQPIRYLTDEANNSWEQAADTGLQHSVDSSSELLTRKQFAGHPGEEMDHSGKEIFHRRKNGKEMDHNGHSGKKSDSREAHATDMGLQQKTCDLNFP
ncbi:uncharacterized protein LOC144864848 [Branchiostoma floridae x Branchiostoma japonicum]